MLKSSLFVRPEVGHRFRAFCLVAAALAGSGCAQPPAVDPVPLRPVLDRAVASLRPKYPEAAAAVANKRQEAEEMSAAAAAAPWWRRRDAGADAAWLEVMREAAWWSRELARSTAATRVRWEATLRTVGDDVERARGLVRSPGMGREESAALRRAELLLGMGRRLAAEGSLDEAVAAAVQAADAVELIELRWAEEHDRFEDPERRVRWRREVEDVVDASRRGRSRAIVVDKLARRLFLYDSGRLALTATAELGANGLQRKRHAGDRATPEGSYRVTVKKEGVATRYYKALLIDYPNSEDMRRFRAAQADGSVPPGVGPGNLIEIHGGGGSGRDWTDGCVALNDADMDRVYSRVSVGTPVVIVGTVEGRRGGGAR